VLGSDIVIAVPLSIGPSGRDKPHLFRSERPVNRLLGCGKRSVAWMHQAARKWGRGLEA
jgi:hypothetical protein